MKSKAPLQRTNEMQKKLDSLYWNTPTICIIRDERESLEKHTLTVFFPSVSPAGFSPWAKIILTGVRLRQRSDVSRDLTQAGERRPNKQAGRDGFHGRAFPM